MRIRIGEKYNRDLTNLDLMGRGVICADSCCRNEGVGDGRIFGKMVECLQFVNDFWMWVWYNENRDGEGTGVSRFGFEGLCGFEGFGLLGWYNISI